MKNSSILSKASENFPILKYALGSGHFNGKLIIHSICVFAKKKGNHGNGALTTLPVANLVS